MQYIVVMEYSSWIHCNTLNVMENGKNIAAKPTVLFGWVSMNHI